MRVTMTKFMYMCVLDALLKAKAPRRSATRSLPEPGAYPQLPYL